MWMLISSMVLLIYGLVHFCPYVPGKKTDGQVI